MLNELFSYGCLTLNKGNKNLVDAPAFSRSLKKYTRCDNKYCIFISF